MDEQEMTVGDALRKVFERLEEMQKQKKEREEKTKKTKDD